MKQRFFVHPHSGRVRGPSRRSSLTLLASVVGCLAAISHAQAPVGVQEPAWSADGKRIAVSYLDRIWTMTADGKQPRALFQDPKPSHLRQGYGGQARPQDLRTYLWSGSQH
jgi:hypothetical protein